VGRAAFSEKRLMSVSVFLREPTPFSSMPPRGIGSCGGAALRPKTAAHIDRERLAIVALFVQEGEEPGSSATGRLSKQSSSHFPARRARRFSGSGQDGDEHEMHGSVYESPARVCERTRVADRHARPRCNL